MRPLAALLAGALAGCGGLTIDAVADSPTEVATVLRVEWTTSEPCTGSVTYGPDALVVETELGTEHAALLLGMRSETEFDYVVECVGEDEVVTETGTATTGILPAWLPPYRLTDASVAPASGHLMIPTLGLHTSERGSPVVLFDEEGEVVWYTKSARNRNASRARVAPDGRSVVLNALPNNIGQGNETTELIRVGWDGVEIERIPVPFHHHDFELLPDGTIAALSRAFGELDPGEYVSWDRIVEVQADGSLDVVFNGIDFVDELDQNVFPLDEPKELGDFRSVPTSNYLHYAPEQDAYYVNAEYGGPQFPQGNPRGVVKFDRADRAIDWVLGGTVSDFEFEEGDAPFLVQHGLDVTEDSVILFANNTPTENCSEVMEFSLGGGHAEYVWRYRPDPCVFVLALGTPQRLSNGHTAVFLSTRGKVTEVDAGGQVLFEMVADFGSALGYGEVLEQFPPAVR